MNGLGWMVTWLQCDTKFKNLKKKYKEVKDHNNRSGSDRRGGAENAGVEKAGVENAGVDSRGGKCRSGKCRSDNRWKAAKKTSVRYPV